MNPAVVGSLRNGLGVLPLSPQKSQVRHKASSWRFFVEMGRVNVDADTWADSPASREEPSAALVTVSGGQSTTKFLLLLLCCVVLSLVCITLFIHARAPRCVSRSSGTTKPS